MEYIEKLLKCLALGLEKKIISEEEAIKLAYDVGCLQTKDEIGYS